MTTVKRGKTAEEIIAEARKISMDGNTPGAFELLLDWLSVSGASEGKIEVLDKAVEYLTKFREDALALREKAANYSEKNILGTAFIEAQKSLDIFEKYGPEISANLTRDLIAKINQKQQEEIKRMEEL